ncbi:MAG: LysE family translocator [Amphiplicatus sp.]
MPLDLFLGFCAASAALIIMPGPVVALIVANSVRQGTRSGFVTVAGSTSAALVHMAFVCAGLASLLAVLGSAFFWLKWAGAAYLLFLGVCALMTAPQDLASEAQATLKSATRTYAEAFLVGVSNPKSLLFFAAFFPLFIAPGRPVLPQLLIMSAAYLVIAAALDTCWALAASRARPVLARAGRWTNRVTGGVLILAAAGLAAARKG